MRARSPFIAMPLVCGIAAFVALQLVCRTPAQSLEKRGLRIATYNISWLSENMSNERKTRLKSVIGKLDADILAMQEIQSQRTLEKLFDSSWQTAIADSAAENQELALAVRKPLRITDYSMVFPDPALDFAFPGKRDTLRATVVLPNGMRIAVYVVHMKSRSGPGGRKASDARRVFASSLLAAYIRGQAEKNVVVLGDFNDSPEDQSVRILQTGNLLAQPGLEDETGPFLYDLLLPLSKKDFVTMGMDERYRGQPILPQVKGARAENDKWRGKDYKYPDDLAVTQVLFDQILVSKSLYEVSERTDIYSGRDAMEGIPGRASKEANGAARYTRQGTLASDHLPVFADFRISKN